MQQKKDADLISRIIVYDDHRAFQQLIERYQKEVRNLLLKLTGFNEQEVDDLAQETFIRVYKYLKTYKANAGFSTWLYRIAYNVYLEAQRKQAKKQSVESESALTSNYNPEAQLNSKMDAKTVLKVLKPEEQVAIQLAYIEGMSHADIAKVLDCPLGTVKTHIKRGKERIRKYLNVAK